MYRVWLVLHVLAAIGGIGPELAFGLMGPHARRAGDRATTSAVYEAIARARGRIVYPLLGLQLISGAALAQMAQYSIFEDAWLRSALGFYAVAIALVFAVLEPTGRRVRRAMRNGVDPGDPSLRPLWKRSAIAGGFAGTLLILTAIWMVAKPNV